MALSIVVPVYRDIKLLQKFIKGIKEQKNKKFELVFVVDTNNENVLEEIDKSFTKAFKKKIKISFNTKRQGYEQAIYEGVKMSSNEYILVFALDDIFDEKMVDDVLVGIKNNKSEIIEFKAAFKEPIKHTGKLRKIVNKPTSVLDAPDIITYSYPFIFNKIFKKELFLRSITKNKIYSLNSRYSISFTYMMLINSKSYSTLNKTIVKSHKKDLAAFNPLKNLREWEAVKNDFKEFEEQYKKEVEYAMFFHQIFFLFGFAGLSKNKVLVKKIETIFDKKFSNQYMDFFSHNKYMLKKNKETELMKKHNSASKFLKVIKGI